MLPSFRSTSGVSTTLTTTKAAAFAAKGGCPMKMLIGFLALGIWIFFRHPEWIPAILLLGGIAFGVLAVLACFCYGVSMLRLFFKI